MGQPGGWGRKRPKPANEVITDPTPAKRAIEVITDFGAELSACGYRKFKISRNGGTPGYRDGNRCRNDHVGLGNVREQALPWRAGTLFGERMRNGPASESALQAARRSERW